MAAAHGVRTDEITTEFEGAQLLAYPALGGANVGDQRRGIGLMDGGDPLRYHVHRYAGDGNVDVQ